MVSQPRAQHVSDSANKHTNWFCTCVRDAFTNMYSLRISIHFFPHSDYTWQLPCGRHWLFVRFAFCGLAVIITRMSLPAVHTIVNEVTLLHEVSLADNDVGAKGKRSHCFIIVTGKAWKRRVAAVETLQPCIVSRSSM